jgi:hypothetical protein
MAERITTKRRVEWYLKGAFTGHDLMVESLCDIDPAAPEVVLKELPEEILKSIPPFAEHYRRATAWSNYGILPADEQVAAAKKWIESFRQPRPVDLGPMRDDAQVAVAPSRLDAAL